MLGDGGLMNNLLFEMRLQGIMVVVFISLVWLFVLVNITTMIPDRRISQRESAIALLLTRHL